MAKVYRIFNASLANKEHWFASSRIGSKVIESIDVQDSLGTRLPTSIPSPFAMIDLVASSFQSVNEAYSAGKDLNSNKDAYQIVSNALDIGQMFFNYDKHKESLTIERWNKNDNLNALLNSNDERHRHFGETMKLFLEGSDSNSYNFDLLDDIFILKYRHQVIGGTSPKTMFFASFDAGKQGVDIEFGQDKMLDNDPLALYLRKDDDYLGYMFSLLDLPEFSSRLPQVYQYIDNTKNELRKTDFKRYQALISASQNESNFSKATLPDNAGVEIASLRGVNVLKAKEKTISSSDFFIKTTRELEKPPMVLPVDPFAKKLKYTSDTWNSSTKVPYSDERPLEERLLPSIRDKYPYLTVGDFLQDSIVKMPYNVDSSKYVSFDKEGKYLCPLKPLIFDYFSSDEIISNKMLLIEEVNAQNTRVSIKIPIQQGEFIVYTKTYQMSGSIASQEEKYGEIKEVFFTFGVFPFIRSSKYEVPYSLFVGEESSSESIKSLTFYNTTNSESENIQKKNRSDRDSLRTSYYFYRNSFDAVELNLDQGSAFVFPLMPNHIDSEDISFGVDFGTTNTHIEIKTNSNQEPKKFDFKQDAVVFLKDSTSKLVGFTKDYVDVLDRLVAQELIPKHLGTKEFQFPTRSALIENMTVNYSLPHELFSHANISFNYTKYPEPSHLKTVTNLKWMNLSDTGNKERVRLYIRELLLLCKVRVLLGNGNLLNTSIKWLYPTSMSYSHKTSFTEIWQNELKNIFPELSSSSLTSMPEGIAPFYYYRKHKGLTALSKPSVSIDVGGGTSDIVIFENNVPTIVSSCKFAGNSIYGDGFNSNVNDNGFVQKYFEKYVDKLNTNGEPQLAGILKSIKEKGVSADVVNFLFSLENNFRLKEHNKNVEFSSDLKSDEELKLPLLLFYSSLVFHVAQMMSKLEKEIPNKILFSGTASKSLQILDPDLKKVNLMFSKIFDFAYKKDAVATIEVKLDIIPKEISSKGALSSDLDEEFDVESVIISDIGATDIKSNVNIKVKEIDEDLIRNVKANYLEFINTFLDLERVVKFKSSFGISSTAVDVLKEIHNSDDIDDYFLLGIEELKKSNPNGEDEVSESLFFYPLLGLLNKLGTKLVQ